MTAVASNVRKPCPFCGSKPTMKRKYVDATYGSCYRLECHGKDCGVKPVTNWLPDTISALRFWNRRVNEVQP